MSYNALEHLIVRYYEYNTGIMNTDKQAFVNFTPNPYLAAAICCAHSRPTVGR